MANTSHRRRITTVALLGGGIAAGVIGATALGAGATTSGTAIAAPATTASSGPERPADAGMPGRRHDGGGAGETAVTGSKAATLKAAALRHVPGATVEEVSTDSGDAAYEVHLRKADGSEVTVKFDKNLAFVAVESGKGR